MNVLLLVLLVFCELLFLVTSIYCIFNFKKIKCRRYNDVQPLQPVQPLQGNITIPVSIIPENPNIINVSQTIAPNLLQSQLTPKATIISKSILKLIPIAKQVTLARAIQE
mgnify:CR=1 FL=1